MTVTMEQQQAVDTHIAAIKRLLPSRPWRPADTALTMNVCNRGVWQGQTFGPCGAPGADSHIDQQGIIRARCALHRGMV